MQLKINVVERGLQWWQIRYAAERREQHTLINARPQQTPHKPAGLWRERERERVQKKTVPSCLCQYSCGRERECENQQRRKRKHKQVKGIVQPKIQCVYSSMYICEWNSDSCTNCSVWSVNESVSTIPKLMYQSDSSRTIVTWLSSLWVELLICEQIIQSDL